MFSIYFPAALAAFLITVLEMTEVVALVFALEAEQGTIRHGALGAVAGTAVVAAVAVVAGGLVTALPQVDLLRASAVIVAAFGVFLFRSTLRTYRRARLAASGSPPPAGHRGLAFASGFSVGATEATEAVVVLLALTAAGYGFTALIGAVVGGGVLVAVALLVHERIRRIKTAWLKLGATSLILSFAAFWGGEALGVAWPGEDLFLVPIFLLVLVVIRSIIELGLRSLRPAKA